MKTRSTRYSNSYWRSLCCTLISPQIAWWIGPCSTKEFALMLQIRRMRRHQSFGMSNRTKKKKRKASKKIKMNKPQWNSSTWILLFEDTQCIPSARTWTLFSSHDGETPWVVRRKAIGLKACWAQTTTITTEENAVKMTADWAPKMIRNRSVIPIEVFRRIRMLAVKDFTHKERCRCSLKIKLSWFNLQKHLMRFNKKFWKRVALIKTSNKNRRNLRRQQIKKRTKMKTK